jgi:thiol-disulfide isomerase/thioredoxin
MGIHVVQDLEDYYKQMMSVENKNKLIICYFTATWCGPCQMIAKDMVVLGNEVSNIQILKIDVDDCEEVSNQCNIDCMPTFKFHLQNNLEPYKQLMGADKNQLLNIVGELLENIEEHGKQADLKNQTVPNNDIMEVPNMYNPLPNHKF